MPDEDDQFGDIAEQLKQTQGEDRANKQDSEQGVDSEASPENAGNPNEEPVASSQPRDSASSRGPAFSFDDTDMHGFYVRDETWDGVTRMRSSVTAACSMFDVSEFEGREFQDACLQVIADHGDEVALQILEQRGIEADEGRVQEVVEMLNKQATNE